jgi:hypothetical protein
LPRPQFVPFTAPEERADIVKCGIHSVLIAGHRDDRRLPLYALI